MMTLSASGGAALLLQNVGWLATAVFTASYFARGERALRRLQVAGASLWLAYGVVIQAPPVIVANILVLAAASWTTWGRRAKDSTAAVTLSR
jgi:hypothetical protein